MKQSVFTLHLFWLYIIRNDMPRLEVIDDQQNAKDIFYEGVRYRTKTVRF
jgi:hypothetical protein